MQGLCHIVDVIKKLYDASYENFGKISKTMKQMWYEERKVIRYNFFIQCFTSIYIDTLHGLPFYVQRNFTIDLIKDTVMY